MIITNYNLFIKESKSIKIDMPLPKDIIDISNQYIKSNMDIFVVGGAVRDFLQNKSPKDYDLVTNALPEESKRILKDFRVSDEQGKNFGVIRVYTKDGPEGYEIASYRKDISLGRDTKGDDQKVEMGKTVTIHDDCMRRDLTINSLFYDIKNKKIVDIVGGVSDIENGIIKSVGDPNKRFLEDRLRICRIFRFASRMNGKIDKETSDAIKRDNRLSNDYNPKEDVSPERIWEEIKKAFKQSKNFSFYLNLLTEYDMWPQVFPGVDINTTIQDTKYLECYLANLLIRNTGSDLLNKLVQQFKIDIDMSRKIIFLISLLGFIENGKIKYHKVVDLYKSKRVSGISNEVILDWYRMKNLTEKVFTSFLVYSPSISSQELMDRGFKGPLLGAEIKRLEIEKFKNSI